MFTIRSLYLLALFSLLHTTVARPLRRSNRGSNSRNRNSQNYNSNGSNRNSNDIVDSALFASLTQSVSFNTVTTTQTQSGLITQICQVTLTPLVVNGLEIVRQDKVCKLDVNGNGNNNNNNNNNGGNENGNNTSTSTTTTETATSTSSFTFTSETNTATTSAGNVNAGISVIGASSTPVGNNGGGQATTTFSSFSTTAQATATAAPAISVVGINSVPNTVPAQANDGGSTATLPVTAVTTLSDGSVSTSVTTPSAAAANAPQAAAVPGRKLEVLPIGLGVFAGVSVIALIVVGLVTYERTKYRKAFRQRKLAEAGANMGYGGMAERT